MPEMYFPLGVVIAGLCESDKVGFVDFSKDQLSVLVKIFCSCVNVFKEFRATKQILKFLRNYFFITRDKSLTLNEGFCP